MNPEDFFDWWLTHPICGASLRSADRLDHTSQSAVRECIRSYGGVYLVVELSTQQQNQRVWEPVGTPGSWGGHAIWADQWTGDLTWATSWGEGTQIDEPYMEDRGFVIGAYELQIVLP
jgi:hypothetical protein